MTCERCGREDCPVAHDPRAHHLPEDPRRAMEELTLDAARIVVDLENRPDAYTKEELKELGFRLTYAMAKLKKQPGGAEAMEEIYAELMTEAKRRGIR